MWTVRKREHIVYCRRLVCFAQKVFASLLTDDESAIIGTLIELSDVASSDVVLRFHEDLITGVSWLYLVKDLLDDEYVESDRQLISKVIQTCQRSDGLFGGNPKSLSGSCLSTFSGCMLMMILTSHGWDLPLSKADLTRCRDSIWRNLHDGGDGAMYFRASIDDKVGFGDLRLIYCSLLSLVILTHLTGGGLITIDSATRDALVKYVVGCHTDGNAFGMRNMAGSHAGETYCGVHILNLLEDGWTVAEHLSQDIRKKTVKWLKDRFREDGSFQGRPGKPGDVCYSFWVCASLVTLEELEWLDENEETLLHWLSRCECVGGGFSKYPSSSKCEADPFHTLFTLCALGLRNTSKYTTAASVVDPHYGCSKSLTKPIGVRQIKTHASSPEPPAYSVESSS